MSQVWGEGGLMTCGSEDEVAHSEGLHEAWCEGGVGMGGDECGGIAREALRALGLHVARVEATRTARDKDLVLGVRHAARADAEAAGDSCAGLTEGTIGEVAPVIRRALMQRLRHHREQENECAPHLASDGRRKILLSDRSL